MMLLSDSVLAGLSAGLAYIGPGAGLGLFAALFSFAAAVVAALAGVLFWPLRNLWRRWRREVPRRQGLHGR